MSLPASPEKRKTELAGILDWINERRNERKSLFNWPKGFPVSKTSIEAEASCDHREVAKAMAQVIVKARAAGPCEEEAGRVLAPQEQGEAALIQTAVERGLGKILRGTLNHGREDQPNVAFVLLL